MDSRSGIRRWCSELLKWQVYDGKDDDTGHRFWMHNVSGEEAWDEDAMMLSSRTRGLAIVTPLLKRNVLAYISDHPKGKATVRWVLPNIIDMLLGNDFDGRYICTRIVRWRELLKTTGATS